MVTQLVDLTQNNLEWTQAILRAAEAKQAPVLIQTSVGAAGTWVVTNCVKSLSRNWI